MAVFKRVYFFLLLTGQVAVAQDVQHSGWLASFNTIKINKQFSLHAELQIRSSNNLQQIQTLLPRVGINFHVRPSQLITAGYAFIPNRVTISGTSSLLGEHRFWQQFIVNQLLPGFALTHRFRLEERFVARGTLSEDDVKLQDRLYSTRLRYFARAVIPFKKQKPFVKGMFGALQEEAFANISNRNNVNGKWFDQNRAYVAIGYRVSKRFDVEAGYLNQYIERKTTQTNLTNHVIQLAFYTRL